MTTLTFLGTSCMVPTKERNVQGIFLKYKTEGLLIDCGEGTQRQMNIAGINRNAVTRVLISHWHGDHVSGLLGLIQTIGNADSQKELRIYGPPGTKEKLNHLLQSIHFDARLHLKVEEINPQGLTKVFETPDFVVECAALDHSIPCLGYRFVEKDRRQVNMAKAKALGLKEGPLIGKLQQGKGVEFQDKSIKPDEVSSIRKGKVIAFILDTTLTDHCYVLAQDADLLVCEAAYTSELEAKARQYKHMTAQQAGLIANKANVKKLILTHISQRYSTLKPLLDDARQVFQEVEVAFDFMKVSL